MCLGGFLFSQKNHVKHFNRSQDLIGEMIWDQLQLNTTIIAALQRAQLKSFREVLCVSGLDLQRLTGLSQSDVQDVLVATAAACRQHRPVTALQLQQAEGHGFESGLRLGVGCPVLDQLLRGGLTAGTITELSGESGAGKTQLGLQLSLSVQYPREHGGLSSGVLYICTEDPFPIRRLQQLISEQSVLRSDVPSSLISGIQFSDQVYIEHTADLESLQVCLSCRAPLLLAQGLVRIVVIDSVAALFRCEFQAEEWVERNKQLLTFSSSLHHLSHQFNIPVLCINQVRDVFNQSADLGPLSSSVCPALGLAWANQVTVRLMMHRLQGMVTRGNQSSALRRLEVVFAPHLANAGRDFAVWREGLRGVLDPEGQ